MHLVLSQRKAVRVRKAFDDCYHAWIEGVPESSHATIGNIATLRHHLDNIIANHKRHECDGQPLDSFLIEAASHLGVIARGMDDIETDRFAALLDDEVQQTSCQRCAGSDDVCRGLPSDDALVSRNGECVSGIMSIHEVVLKIASRTYAQAGCNAVTTIDLSTRHVKVEPGEVGEPNGRTILRDKPGSRASEVVLGLPALSYDAAVEDSIFYTLMHEIVCHSYQSLVVPEERVLCVPTDPFHEGWMDVVAYEMVNRAISGFYGSDISRSIRRRDAVRRRAMERHARRLPRVATDPASRARLWGARIAERVRQDFFARHRDPTRAWSDLIEFSLRLNLGLAADDGLRVVVAFQRGLSEPGMGTGVVPRRARQKRARDGSEYITNYLRDRDLGPIIEWARDV